MKKLFCFLVLALMLPLCATAQTRLSDSQLANAYSGVGACAAHQWVSTINRNAAPSCSQPSYADISGTPTLRYQTIKVAGVAQPQEPNLNFTSGVSCSDNPGTSSTDCSPTTGGSGTVTSVSAGNLAPLFTTSVATPTTTPALSFTLSTAAAHSFFGNNAGVTAAPAFVQPAFSDLSGTATAGQEPTTTVNSVTNDTNVTGSIASQTLTLGFTGTLAKGRTLGTTVYTDQSNTYSAGTQDFSGAAHTLPALKGLAVSKPATCTVGELYFATDATAGQNIYECAATNTWTQQLNSGGGAGIPAPAGALVELPLTDCSGTTATDVSGNGNNGTLHGSPTWGPSGACGLTFGTDNTKWLSLPVGVSATARTFLAFVKSPTLGANYVTLFGTDSGSGVDLLLYETFNGGIVAANNWQHVLTPGTFDVTANQVTTLGAEVVGGYESVGWVSDATADRLYINGTESSFYTLHGGTAAHIAGTITVGADERSAGSACGACAFPGTVYYVMVYPRELTAAEVAEADNYMRQKLIQRGIQINPAPAAADGTNQIACVGDSLTDGNTATSYCSQLSGLSQTWSETNFGVGSLDLQQMYSNATGIDASAFSVNNMRRVVVLWGGTNDMCNGTPVSAAAAFNRLLQTTNRYHALGDKVIWLDMISRTGTGFGAATCDSLKDSYNALLRKWPQFGVDGFVDLGEDTNFGADGTNTGASFQVDHIHLTTAAQGVVAGYVSSAINMLENGPFMQPTVFTGTATMADSDFNAEGDTTAAAFTLTLPTCSAKTGYIYKIKNSPAANTLTVHGNGSQLVDGAASFTLAQFASAQLQVVVNTPASGGGCHWRKLN